MSPPTTYLTPERLDAAVSTAALLFGLPPTLLRGVSRAAPVSAARLALYAGLRRAGVGLVEIGQALRRDHTTVVYGAKTAEERAIRDESYARAIAAIAEAAGFVPPTAPDPCAGCPVLADLTARVQALESALAAALHATEGAIP